MREVGTYIESKIIRLLVKSQVSYNKFRYNSKINIEKSPFN
ncbi:hypothetical protein MNBD_GAMMA12-535 [hydrothermal vent metagenome]|uniref:Uncharacterized protein n=1 Tax=hydrothermal vent metagenome TaxID=652676 RepID=A0A3B0YW44_9ZZZZ